MVSSELCLKNYCTYRISKKLIFSNKFVLRQSIKFNFYSNIQPLNV